MPAGARRARGAPGRASTGSAVREGSTPLSAVPTAAITAATPATASHRPPGTLDSRDARDAPGTSGGSAARGPPASSASTAGSRSPYSRS